MASRARWRVNAPTAPLARTSQRSCGRHGLACVDGNGLATVRPVLCLSWGCARCAPLLARRWARTFEHCGFRPTAFVTLTLDPRRLTAECTCVHCWTERHPGTPLDTLRKLVPRSPACHLTDYPRHRRFLAARLKMLYRRLRRRYGPLQYFRIYEFHGGAFDAHRRVNNHRLHVHLLMRTAAPHGGYPLAILRRLRRPDLQPYRAAHDVIGHYATEAGFGRSEATGLVDDGAARSYVHKYTCKRKSAVHRYRVRLVATSRDIRHAAAPQSTSTWHFVPYHGNRYWLGPTVCDELHARSTADPSTPLGLDTSTGHLHTSAHWLAVSNFTATRTQRERWRGRLRDRFSTHHIPQLPHPITWPTTAASPSPTLPTAGTQTPLDTNSPCALTT